MVFLAGIGATEAPGQGYLRDILFGLGWRLDNRWTDLDKALGKWLNDASREIPS